MAEELVGTEIARLRKARNLSQSELAEMLNLTHQAVSKWERGESLPDVGILVPLANVLGVSVDALLRAVDDKGGRPGAAQAPAGSGLWRRARTWMAPEPQERLPENAVPAATEAAAGSSGAAGGPTLDDVVALAPFVPPEVLSQMVVQFVPEIDWDQLTDLAPFMTPEALVETIRRRAEMPPAALIRDLAPFLDGPFLAELVRAVPGRAWSWDAVRELAPFMPREAVAELVTQLAANGEGPGD